MKKNDAPMRVQVKEWREGIINNAINGQKSLDALVEQYQKYGLPLPDNISDLSTDYVISMIERGRSAYNGSEVFVPVSIKERNNLEFDKALATLKPIAMEIQRILNENPYTVTRNGTGWEFDKEEVAEAAEKNSVMILEGETVEYLNILKALAKAMEDARTWEKEHGWVEFIGKDEMVSLTDGRVLFFGWSDKMTDPETKRFGITPERYVEMMLHGAVGKSGEV